MGYAESGIWLHCDAANRSNDARSTPIEVLNCNPPPSLSTRILFSIRTCPANHGLGLQSAHNYAALTTDTDVNLLGNSAYQQSVSGTMRPRDAGHMHGTVSIDVTRSLLTFSYPTGADLGSKNVTSTKNNSK